MALLAAFSLNFDLPLVDLLQIGGKLVSLKSFFLACRVHCIALFYLFLLEYWQSGFGWRLKNFHDFTSHWWGLFLIFGLHETYI